MMSDSNLILNVRKPIGWTSYDVVRYIKRMIPGKIGHAGTLDPFADGVLIICAGKATKSIQQYVDAEKEYNTLIKLGMETDTLDISGKVVKKRKIPGLDRDQLLHVLNSFTGQIIQKAPAYSAVKVRGKKLYQLARKNENVSLPERLVTVYKLQLQYFEKNSVFLNVVCSKGTYIRSLARDIGDALGTAAYVQTLTRIRIGEYTLENAIEVTDIQPEH